MLGSLLKFFRTLRAQFLRLVLLTGIIPLGLVGFGIAFLNSRTIRDQSARELTGLARGMAGETEVYLTGLFEDSQAMAAFPEIASVDPARQESILKELFHHYRAFVRLSTFDLSGRLLASSRSGQLPSIESRASFRKATRQGSVFTVRFPVQSIIANGEAGVASRYPIRRQTVL